ncbi:MAG TPA: hypothetical protein EYG89_03890 [Bacteroidia bacterium]|nr:hypothetical protein [Arcobacter sp.]HIP33863.1 hypothetical protein [Bacteroidia bacterium]
MFIKINNQEQAVELKEINLKIKKLFGTVPPNLELLGNIDVNILKDFLVYVSKLMNHKTINPDYFGFLRLFIANQEDFKYCIGFNTMLLQSRNYEMEVINNSKLDLSKIPFDEKHKLLAIKSIKSIFDSKNFNQNDFNELYKIGWNDKDIFDSIEHAAILGSGDENKLLSKK